MGRAVSGHDSVMDTRLPPLASNSGVFMTYELLAHGLDDKALTKFVRSGELHRLRQGAYCRGTLWRGLDEEGRRALVAHAAYRSARTHVLMSHTTAADRFGVPVWDMPDLSHFTRTDGKAGRREAGVVQHRGLVTADDVTFRDGFWMTSGTRTALDCTTIADTEHGLVIVNGLLHAGETTVEQMEHRLATMTHWPETLHTDVVLRLANAKCESVGETRSFHLCYAQGLPMPIPQFPVLDRNGRVIAWVDLAWPELGTFLEFDGRVKYEKLLKDGESPSDVVIREKRREERICGLTGWRCVRITWADLHHPDRTAARIRATFARQPWAA